VGIAKMHISISFLELMGSDSPGFPCRLVGAALQALPRDCVLIGFKSNGPSNTQASIDFEFSFYSEEFHGGEILQPKFRRDYKPTVGGGILTEDYFDSMEIIKYGTNL